MRFHLQFPSKTTSFIVPPVAGQAVQSAYPPPQQCTAALTHTHTQQSRLKHPNSKQCSTCALPKTDDDMARCSAEKLHILDWLLEKVRRTRCNGGKYLTSPILKARGLCTICVAKRSKLQEFNPTEALSGESFHLKALIVLVHFQARFCWLRISPVQFAACNFHNVHQCFLSCLRFFLLWYVL